MEVASKRQFAYSVLQGRESPLIRSASDLRLTGIFQTQEPKHQKNSPVFKKRQGP